MHKYTVIGIVDATVSAEVEASSTEEAMEKAKLSASVCHLCAKDLDVGGVYDVMVLGDKGKKLVELEQDRDYDRMKNALLDVVKFAESNNLPALERLAKNGIGL